MISNYEEFINSINYKGINNKGSIYAQIIKGERIKQNKTLEEVASGICSISYLCKLENYMIYPPQNLVKQVFEKMNITYDDINEENLENILDDSIVNFYSYDKEKLYNDYLKVKQFSSSPQVVLLKCLYLLLMKDYDRVSKEVSFLDSIKDTLGGSESVLLILVTILYYIGRRNYKKASLYLRCLDFLNIDNKYIKYILYDANLVSSFHLRNVGRFTDLYNKIDSYDYIGLSMSKRIVYRLMYDIIEYDDFPNQAVIDCDSIDLNEYMNNDYYERLYYKYIIYINSKKYFEVFKDIIDNKYYENIVFTGLLGVCAYFINQKEYYNKLIDVINEIENIMCSKENEYHKNFIDLLLINFGNNKQQLRDFIKTDYYNNIAKCNNYFYDYIYNEIYINLLAATHQYKEAFYYLLNITKIKINRQ